MRCGKCLKPDITYSGTGHRMENYPWAEKTASNGRGCTCKEPWFPDCTKTPEEVAEYKAKTGALMDKLVANTVTDYRSQMIELYKINKRPRLDWMTDEQWQHIEKERAR